MSAAASGTRPGPQPAAGAVPALGPTVGKALIGAGGWRAIFLINVPLGALAALAVRFVPAALDLSLARQAVPALSMVLCALASVVTWAAVFLLPVFVQTAAGRSTLEAGLALLPGWASTRCSRP